MVFLSGCVSGTTSITVISNPPGAKAFVGPFGSHMHVDSNEEPSRARFIGITPITIQSSDCWNEWGHAWAWVEWPDGTTSVMRVRKPVQGSFAAAAAPVTFEFSETGSYYNQPTYSAPAQTPNLASTLVGTWSSERGTAIDDITIRSDLTCDIGLGFVGGIKGHINILGGNSFKVIGDEYGYGVMADFTYSDINTIVETHSYLNSLGGPPYPNAIFHRNSQ